MVPPPDTAALARGVPALRRLAPARPAPRWLRRAGLFAGRSLLPLVALALIVGTLWWGPWVTLVLAAAWWVTVTRIG